MGFWAKFSGAFHSPATYLHVRYQEKNWGLMYGLLVVALMTLIGCAWMFFMFQLMVLSPHNGQPPLLDRMVGQMSDQLPELKIERGVLSVNAPQPVTIYTQDNVDGTDVRGALVTIDTTGQVTYATMQTPILVTAHEIITRDRQGKVELHPITDLTDVVNKPVLTRDDVRGYLIGFAEGVHRYYLYGLPIIWGICCFVFFLGRAVMLLVLGVVGYMAGKVLQAPMNYMTGVRLAALAYTPLALFDTLAFVLVFKTASAFTMGALGAALTIGAVLITNPRRQDA